VDFWSILNSVGTILGIDSQRLDYFGDFCGRARRLDSNSKNPDQTFALVLVPASTKIEEKFNLILPSAVAPLRHPQNSQNGARAEGDKKKAEEPFLPSAVPPF
jgi:hypothetical protein